MAGKRLGEKQQQILNYIKEEIQAKGYPPSVREICEAVHLKSTSTVHGHLARLERNGYIRRDPTKPRAIEVLDAAYSGGKKSVVQVPVVGKVTAGQPILAIENIEDSFPLSVDFVRDQDTAFVLHVHGESMIEAGILDGDLVVVRQQATAENGDIVVAMVEDEATVKRFYKEQGHIRLQPENPYMEPIIVPNATILGRVIGLYRTI
ncbi:MAG: transcriptional repressor LexA [Christensenellales bacterium]|jgi:repressor LexA